MDRICNRIAGNTQIINKMGRGESQMVKWAYTGCGLAVGSGIFLMIVSVFLIVVVKGSTSFEFRDNMVYVCGAAIAVGLSAIIVSSVAMQKIWSSNQLYLRVIENASAGKVALTT